MSDTSPTLRLTNTLTRTKEAFRPIDPQNVRMYVCGPTVYDYAHIGNARPAIVFDVLFRLLRHIYGPEHVAYVRNITDVDDKINARAARDFPGLPLNEAIRRVTESTARQYEADVAALGCLSPTFEPRATDFVLPRADGKADMATLIQALLDRGNAYHAAGEILFDTRSMPDYGALSRRPLDEQIAGARVAVDAHKKHPADFVLWKQSGDDEPGWDANFRVGGRDFVIRGRPGWHIECSAMCAAYLGEVFDIHGGGLDLIFPHHENEIAQSRCAHGTRVMANLWMHNGFLQVEGRKMSKSEGNFVTIHDLLHTDKFGGRKWPGEVLRLAMLMTHYREPIDFSVRRLEEAETIFNRWVDAMKKVERSELRYSEPLSSLPYLRDDLDTSSAVMALTRSASSIDDAGELSKIFADLHLLGFVSSLEDFQAEGLAVEAAAAKAVQGRPDVVRRIQDGESPIAITEELVAAANLFSSSVLPASVALELASSGLDFDLLNQDIEHRPSLISDRNWAEADRIRSEWLARGIQLKDGKNPETGERMTTWEVKR